MMWPKCMRLDCDDFINSDCSVALIFLLPTFCDNYNHCIAIMKMLCLVLQ